MIHFVICMNSDLINCSTNVFKASQTRVINSDKSTAYLYPRSLPRTKHGKPRNLRIFGKHLTEVLTGFVSIFYSEIQFLTELVDSFLLL